MAQYLLSIYQPDGTPPPEVLARMDDIMRDVGALIDDLKREGAWVFDGGLHPPSTATVLRVREDHGGGHRLAADPRAPRRAARRRPQSRRRVEPGGGGGRRPEDRARPRGGPRPGRVPGVARAVRADLLDRLGRVGEAAQAYVRAAELAGSRPERDDLLRRAAGVAGP